jgi:ABC-type bacteriocin/lantibiotic exporter with double-glycine peptidase domain
MMATLVTEFTRLTREFRIMGVEDSAIHRLQQGNHQAAVSSNKNRRLMQINPVVYQIVALGFIVLGLTIFLGHTGTSLGSTGAVILLMLRSLTYGQGVQASSQMLRSYEGFLSGLEADIARYSASPAEINVGKLPEKFDVVFDDVSFAYSPEVFALRDISFSVPSGKILGVVGTSGSGKTTLSQLVLGMRKPWHGRVLLGDVPAASVCKGKGSSPIALVAQESVLLQGSITTNIAFFRQVSQYEIEVASRAAHLHEDVIEMTDLYETQVGEGGGSLSGGQRQRLAIARALVGSPRLLVLDEPTSALDGRSENLVRRTLSELRDRVTVIVISHRMAMVADCDLLLVLDKGVVADFGPRNEVVNRPPFRYAAETEAVQSATPNLLK